MTKIFPLAMMFFFSVQYTCVAEPIELAQDPWPPITAADIPNEALATDIVTTAFRQAGFDPDVVTIPWKRALLEVELLKKDAIVAAYYNDERSKIYNYSAPYLTTPILMLKRKDLKVGFETLRDLDDLRIGFVRATSYGNSFDTADHLNKVELSDPNNIIRMLYFKRLELAPFTNVVGMHIITTKFPEWKDELEYFGPPLAKLRYYVIVGKKHPKGDEILTRFNNAIAHMISHGKIEQIIKAHNLQDAFPDTASGSP